MLFEKRLQDGLTDGSTTVALRRWKKPQALPGRNYRSPIGMVACTAVEVVDTIDEATAKAAGFASIEAALDDLPGEGPITVLHLHLVDEADPRDVLSNDTRIADPEKLKRQVERYRPHLELIAVPQWTVDVYRYPVAVELSAVPAAGVGHRPVGAALTHDGVFAADRGMVETQVGSRSATDQQTVAKGDSPALVRREGPGWQI